MITLSLLGTSHFDSFLLRHCVTSQKLGIVDFLAEFSGFFQVSMTTCCIFITHWVQRMLAG